MLVRLLLLLVVVVVVVVVVRVKDRDAIQWLLPLWSIILLPPLHYFWSKSLTIRTPRKTPSFSYVYTWLWHKTMLIFLCLQITLQPCTVNSTSAVSVPSALLPWWVCFSLFRYSKEKLMSAPHRCSTIFQTSKFIIFFPKGAIFVLTYSICLSLTVRCYNI